MNLSGDNKDKKKLNPVLFTTMVSAILIVATLIGILFLTDYVKNNVSENSTPVSEANDAETVEEEEEYTVGTLTPDDFDFWDKYPKPEKETPKDDDNTAKPLEQAKEDPSADGKHTKVINRDGEEEWVLISQYLPRSEYSYTELVCQSGLMKYYTDGKLTSYVGVDVSKYQDYIDFVKVKKSGIDFVMVRVGARGYGSGQLILDDYYAENLKRATDAGLDVGLYFFSQAVSVEEAVEEANLVLDSVADYNITYPVAIDMEFVENDTARIEALNKSEKTDITKAFLDTVSAAGYKGMIYGDKEWLIKEIDLSKLTDYDIWLAQYEDIPDYPYKFTMWQYDIEGNVDGIVGYCDLNISFIDYKEK